MFPENRVGAVTKDRQLEMCQPILCNPFITTPVRNEIVLVFRRLDYSH